MRKISVDDLSRAVEVSRNIVKTLDERGIDYETDRRFVPRAKYAQVTPEEAYSVFRAGVGVNCDDFLELDRDKFCLSIQQTFEEMAEIKIAAFYKDCKRGLEHGAYVVGEIKDKKPDVIVILAEAAGYGPLTEETASLLSPKIWFPFFSPRTPGNSFGLPLHTLSELELYVTGLMRTELYSSKPGYENPVRIAKKFLAGLQGRLKTACPIPV